MPPHSRAWLSCIPGHGLSAESSSCGLSADAFQAGDAHHPAAPLIPQLDLAPRDHSTQRCARPSPKPHKHGDDGFRQQSPVGAAVSGCKRLSSQRLSSKSLGGKSRSCHEHLSMTHSCHSLPQREHMRACVRSRAALVTASSPCHREQPFSLCTPGTPSPSLEEFRPWETRAPSLPHRSPLTAPSSLSRSLACGLPLRDVLRRPSPPLREHARAR